MRIRTRIIGATLLVVVVANFTYTGYFIRKERNEALARLEATIEETNRLLNVVNAGPLYDGNVEQLNTNLDSFFRNPDILEMELTENGGDIRLKRSRTLPSGLGSRLATSVTITRGIDELGTISTVYTTGNIEQRLQESRNELVLFSAALAAGLLIVILMVTRGLTRPIERLTTAAQAMADGQLDQDIDTGGAHELAILGESFGRMRDAIHQKIAALAENNRLLNQEIEQRRNAESERDRLVSILEATTDLVGIADPDASILYLNRAGRAMVGAGDKPTREMRIADFHPAWASELILKEGMPAAVRAGSWSGETALLAPDGEEIPVSQLILGHKDAHGRLLYFSTIMRDITEHKRAEEEISRINASLEERVRRRTAELEQQSHRNELILGTAIDGFFCADATGRMRDTNPAYCTMLGYTRDELLGLSIRDIEANESQQEMAAHIEKVMASRYDRFDTRHRRKDGSLVDVELSANLVELAGEPLFFCFVRDITERKNAEEKLLAARDEAERANLAKSEFLSRMSHELRTPLNAVLGFGQLLEFDPQIPDKQQGWIREILSAGRHLLELINEVLDLARVESGKFTVSPEPVVLLPLIDECLTLVRPQAEAQAIRLFDASRHCDVHVRADRTRLKQVLLNLLSNAVKYNRPRGTVSVVCVAEAGTVRIRISDTGPGLTAEQQARLFVPFERLDADQQHIEGTGIGLTLSKRLVELMHGTIGVESTPGSGSTFWVSLPLADSHATEAAPAPAAVRPPSPTAEARPLDVLCIEDNPANLRLIESVLAKRAGIRVLSAIAPSLGLELARTHQPALILLDINLPDMDGYAVMQCLRENALTRDIPVVAISANAMPKDLERGKAAGFVAYLTKPLDVQQLTRLVEQITDQVWFTR